MKGYCQMILQYFPQVNFKVGIISHAITFWTITHKNGQVC